MNVIFEGCDRVGKTSLIDAYAAPNPHYRRDKMKVPRTLAEANVFYNAYYMELWTSTRPTLYDRGHISEQVYGPLYRPETVNNWWPSLLNVQELVPPRQRTVIVYVYPVWLSLLKSDERIGSNLTNELQVYDTVLSYSHWPVIRITKHHIHSAAWRNMDDVLYELDLALREYR